MNLEVESICTEQMCLNEEKSKQIAQETTLITEWNTVSSIFVLIKKRQLHGTGAKARWEIVLRAKNKAGLKCERQRRAMIRGRGGCRPWWCRDTESQQREKKQSCL